MKFTTSGKISSRTSVSINGNLHAIAVVADTEASFFAKSPLRHSFLKSQLSIESGIQFHPAAISVTSALTGHDKVTERNSETG